MSSDAFTKLGLAHAELAIDQLADEPQARGAYEDNLCDTLAEQFPNATRNECDSAIAAYNAAWDRYLKK